MYSELYRFSTTVAIFSFCHFLSLNFLKTTIWTASFFAKRKNFISSRILIPRICFTHRSFVKYSTFKIGLSLLLFKNIGGVEDSIVVFDLSFEDLTMKLTLHFIPFSYFNFTLLSDTLLTLPLRLKTDKVVPNLLGISKFFKKCILYLCIANTHNNGYLSI